MQVIRVGRVLGHVECLGPAAGAPSRIPLALDFFLTHLRPAAPRLRLHARQCRIRPDVFALLTLILHPQALWYAQIRRTHRARHALTRASSPAYPLRFSEWSSPLFALKEAESDSRGLPPP